MIPNVWTRSTRCEAGDCVEVRAVPTGVELRDSKDPDGPVLRFTAEEWEAFVAGVNLGEFDV